MIRSAFGNLMGGPESGPFLQRFITIFSTDQRYFIEIIHHNSIKCCQDAYGIISIALKFQVAYQHALARKRWILGYESRQPDPEPSSFSTSSSVSLLGD